MMSPLSVAVIATFPDLIDEALRYGVTGRAREAGLWRFAGFSLKEFATDARRTIDARPAGGGPGMVLLPAPLDAAMLAASAWHLQYTPQRPRVILLTPDGAPMQQTTVRQWAQSLLDGRAMTLVAGRYEGIDKRWLDANIDEAISLGDFVLSGGELPAAVLIDACVRLLPGALGNEGSTETESFASHRLDWPYYAQGVVDPAYGQTPPALLSGDHAEVVAWRARQSLERTLQRRPELLAREKLKPDEQALLTQIALQYKALLKVGGSKS